MGRLFLLLAIMSAYFGICGESESWPSPGVMYCASTDFGMEIQWYYPGKSSSMDLKGLHFRIISEVRLKGKTLTIRSTMTIEHLSTAYVGGYMCTDVTGNMKVESDVFHVLFSGRHRY